MKRKSQKRKNNISHLKPRQVITRVIKKPYGSLSVGMLAGVCTGLYLGHLINK